ncbi:hypothetical protein DFJ77DRAFT_434441 [Powellomyces hirtus]|nr:hypothetical protein DFJ77DRAFT_434441 [Powellomyces hirtus]
MQSNTAAVAAEGLLPGNRTVKPEDDDEEEGSVSGEDEEEEEGEATEYRCQWTDCDHLFNSVDDLVSHVSELHIGAGKANYTCLWKGCTREQRPFTKRHKIHNHLRIHTGERPFQCPVADCGKKFSRQDGLNTHIKTHSNIKPYVCAIFNCGKAYYHSRSLRKHEKTHFVPTMMNINFLQQAGMMNPETFNTVWSNMAANGGAMPPPPSGMGFGGGLASNHDPAAYGQMQMQMQKMYFAQQAMQAGMGGYPSPMTYADAGMGGAAGAGGMGMNGWLDHHQPEQFGTIVGSNFNV